MPAKRGGRYSAGEHSGDSLTAVIATGMHRATLRHEPHTVYVRELGRMDALRIIERNDEGIVTVKRPS